MTHANAVDVGFGVLYVDAPVGLCRARNARRRDVTDSVHGHASEYVPADVFERMVQAFEPPDPRRTSWESNTSQLFQTDSDDHVSGSPEGLLRVAQTALASITTEAARALTRQREEKAGVDRKRAQQVRTRPPGTAVASPLIRVAWQQTS